MGDDADNTGSDAVPAARAVSSGSTSGASMSATAPADTPSAERETDVQKSGHQKSSTARCGCCSEGKNCCIEIFISGLQFLRNSDGDMEIIVAVRAGDTWGLLPGLDSYVSLDQGNERVIPFHSVVSRICLGPDECRQVPLRAEAMEVVQKGGAFEGRPETGSMESSMTVSCRCPETKVMLAVPFRTRENGRIKGIVGVELSSRLFPGSCC